MGHGFYAVISEEIKSGNITEIKRLLTICGSYISPAWQSILLFTAESLNNHEIKNLFENNFKNSAYSSSDDDVANENQNVSSKFALKTMLGNAIANGYATNMSRFELSKLLGEAAAYGNLEDVKKIVEQGAWILFADSDGKTPLDIATENNNLEVARYLENKQFTYFYKHDRFWEDLNAIAIMDGNLVQLERQLQLITDKNLGPLLNQECQSLKVYGFHECKQAYLRTFDYALHMQNPEIIDILFSSPLFNQSNLSEFIADLIIYNSHSAMIPLAISYPGFSFSTALDRAASLAPHSLDSFLQRSISFFQTLDLNVLNTKVNSLKNEMKNLKKNDHYYGIKKAVEILEFYSKMLKQAEKDPTVAMPQTNFFSRKN